MNCNDCGFDEIYSEIMALNVLLLSLTCPAPIKCGEKKSPATRNTSQPDGKNTIFRHTKYNLNVEKQFTRLKHNSKSMP